MKRISKVKKSLTLFCVVYFAIHTFVIALICIGFAYLENKEIDKTFFTMDDLLNFEDELVSEDYTRIPAGDFTNSAFIIFDESGSIQYASNRKIGETVFFSDAEMIGDYSSDMFFDVFQNTAEDGSALYYVYLNDYTPGSKAARIVDSCILDENYTIISGSLFPDRSSLSEREFELLSGVSKTNSTLEKYVYRNTDGDKRILVFLSMGLNDAQHYRMMKSVHSIWILGTICVLTTVVLSTALFSGKIKRRIAPLNELIVSYKRGEAKDIALSEVPSEFYKTVGNFRSLLSRLELAEKEKDVLYAEKQKLIVDISHDLKTPLTIIQGYAKALFEQRVPPEKQAAYIQSIFRKAKLASDMVSDLFMYTQMEHPDYQMNREKTDFCEFVKSFFAEKYMDITENGFCLLADIGDEPIVLQMDRRLIRRLLENLLSNAMKYNPKGTTVFVSVERKDSEVRMTIADDGIGISEEIVHTLFQPFVTGNSARTAGKGTGLGLSIAQRIVEMHHGKITLLRIPGNKYQTEFRVTFPCTENG